MHSQYNENVAEVMGYMVQKASSEKGLGTLRRRVEVFKRMLVGRLRIPVTPGWYTVRYYSLSYMSEDKRRFGTLPVLDKSSYEHVNGQLKQIFTRTWQSRQTRMMETLNATERNYEIALLYVKESIGENLRKNDKRHAGAEMNGGCLVCAALIIKIG